MNLKFKNLLIILLSSLFLFQAKFANAQCTHPTLGSIECPTPPGGSSPIPDGTALFSSGGGHIASFSVPPFTAFFPSGFTFMQFMAAMSSMMTQAMDSMMGPNTAQSQANVTNSVTGSLNQQPTIPNPTQNLFTVFSEVPADKGFQLASANNSLLADLDTDFRGNGTPISDTTVAGDSTKDGRLARLQRNRELFEGLFDDANPKGQLGRRNPDDTQSSDNTGDNQDENSELEKRFQLDGPLKLNLEFGDKSTQETKEINPFNQFVKDTLTGEKGLFRGITELFQAAKTGIRFLAKESVEDELEENIEDLEFHLDSDQSILSKHQDRLQDAIDNLREARKTADAARTPGNKLRARQEVKNAQDAVDEAQKKVDASQDQLDATQKKLKLAKKQLEAFDKKVAEQDLGNLGESVDSFSPKTGFLGIPQVQEELPQPRFRLPQRFGLEFPSKGKGDSESFPPGGQVEQNVPGTSDESGDFQQAEFDLLGGDDEGFSPPDHNKEPFQDKFADLRKRSIEQSERALAASQRVTDAIDKLGQARLKQDASANELEKAVQGQQAIEQEPSSTAKSLRLRKARKTVRDARDALDSATKEVEDLEKEYRVLKDIADREDAASKQVSDAYFTAVAIDSAKTLVKSLEAGLKQNPSSSDVGSSKEEIIPFPEKDPTEKNKWLNRARDLWDDMYGEYVFGKDDHKIVAPNLFEQSTKTQKEKLPLQSEQSKSQPPATVEQSFDGTAGPGPGFDQLGTGTGDVPEGAAQQDTLVEQDLTPEQQEKMQRLEVMEKQLDLAFAEGGFAGDSPQQKIKELREALDILQGNPVLADLGIFGKGGNEGITTTPSSGQNAPEDFDRGSVNQTRDDFAGPGTGFDLLGAGGDDEHNVPPPSNFRQRQFGKADQQFQEVQTQLAKKRKQLQGAEATLLRAQKDKEKLDQNPTAPANRLARPGAEQAVKDAQTQVDALKQEIKGLEAQSTKLAKIADDAQRRVNRTTQDSTQPPGTDSEIQKLIDRAVQGDPEARKAPGNRLFGGGDSDNMDIQKLRKAANQGDRNAQVELYKDLLGRARKGDKDATEALTFLKGLAGLGGRETGKSLNEQLRRQQRVVRKQDRKIRQLEAQQKDTEQEIERLQKERRAASTALKEGDSAKFQENLTRFKKLGRELDQQKAKLDETNAKLRDTRQTRDVQAEKAGDLMRAIQAQSRGVPRDTREAKGTPSSSTKSSKNPSFQKDLDVEQGLFDFGSDSGTELLGATGEGFPVPDPAGQPTQDGGGAGDPLNQRPFVKDSTTVSNDETDQTIEDLKAFPGLDLKGMAQNAAEKAADALEKSSFFTFQTYATTAQEAAEKELTKLLDAVPTTFQSETPEERRDRLRQEFPNETDEQIEVRAEQEEQEIQKEFARKGQDGEEVIGEEIVIDESAKAALARNIAIGIRKGASFTFASGNREDFQKAAKNAVDEELQKNTDLQALQNRVDRKGIPALEEKLAELQNTQAEGGGQGGNQRAEGTSGDSDASFQGGGGGTLNGQAPQSPIFNDLQAEDVRNAVPVQPI